MKIAEIKLGFLTMLFLLVSITPTNANDRETLEYNASSEMIIEGEHVDLLASPLNFDQVENTLTTFMLYRSCYEYKKVWTWSGWFPKRVWKWVRVTCPQAAANRGPGTTIPPH